MKPKPKNPNAVALGTLGGRVKSEAKAAAARANGRLGGKKYDGAGHRGTVHTEQRGRLHRWKLLNGFGGLIEQSAFSYPGKGRAIVAGQAALRETNRGADKSKS